MVTKGLSDGPSRSSILLNVDFENRFIGDYRLVEKLGEGGSASVWRAVNPALEGSEYALKLFGFRAASRKDAQVIGNQLKQDSNALLKLRNKTDHVVRVITTASQEGAIFALENKELVFCESGVSCSGSKVCEITVQALVIELLDGGSLDNSDTLTEVLADEPWFVRQLMGVVDAITAAHALPFIHCDIKPDNLFWDRSKRPKSTKPRLKLGDWGVSRSLFQDPSHASGAPPLDGTPEYLAPECFDNAAAAPARDVYALGCAILELVSGSNPFKRTSGSDPKRVEACKNAHQCREDPVVYTQQKCASRLQRCLELEWLVNRMLERDPEQRIKLDGVRRGLERVLRAITPPALSIDTLDPWTHGSEPKAHNCFPVSTCLRDWRQEQAVFLFVDPPTDQASGSKEERILELARHFFPAGLSVVEIYGTHGFVIRAWDREPFETSLGLLQAIRHRGEMTPPQCIICDGAFDLSTAAADEIDESLDVGADRELFWLQRRPVNEWGASEHERALQLHAKGAIVYPSRRKKREPVPVFDGKRIPCYSVINCRSVGHEHKQMRAEKLRDRLRKSDIPPSRLENGVLYTATQNLLDNTVGSMPAQFVIGFVAKTYDEVRTIPRLILNVKGIDLGHTTTWTFPATREFGWYHDGLLDWSRRK